jgi:two-component system, sensor histidine kinase PdtaS
MVIKLLAKIVFLVALVGLIGVQVTAQRNLSSKVDAAWELRSNHPDSAYQVMQDLLLLSQEASNKREEARVFAFLGIMDDIKGNSDMAIRYLLKAAKIQEDKFPKDLSFTYNNLGVAYFFQYNYSKALEYYKLSYSLDERHKDEKGMAGTLVNIGVVYTYLDSMPEAKQMYLKAKEVYEKQRDTAGIVSVLNNVGKIQFSEKKFTESIATYNEAIAYSIRLKNPEISFSTYYGLSQNYMRTGDFPKALHYGHLSVDLASRAGARERLQYGYELLAEIYAAKNDFVNGYSYMRKYAGLRDSLVNEDMNSKITEMQTLYEIEKKDKLLAEAALERKQADYERKESIQKMNQQHAQRNWLIVVMGVTLVMLFVLLYAYRVKQRNAYLLAQRNAAIQQNLEQKETMIGEIHHRVKNNLQLINSILDLQSKELTDEKALRAISDSRHRVSTMSLIHQKLYAQDNIYGIQMDEYLTQLCNGLVQSSRKENLKLNVQTSIEPIQLHIDSSIPIGLIVTEVLTNALKYAFTGRNEGTIELALHLRKDELHIQIKDDGIGMTNAIPDPDGTSFGMKMVKSLCRQLKAEMQISENNGTCVKFVIRKFRLSE